MRTLRDIEHEMAVVSVVVVLFLFGGCGQTEQGQPMEREEDTTTQPAPDTADTAMIDTADTANGNGENGDTTENGVDKTMNADTGALLDDFGPAGRTTATVSSVITRDSMIVISDTILIEDETAIEMNGETATLEQLRTGREVEIEYEIINGRKVATEIVETVEPHDQ